MTQPPSPPGPTPPPAPTHPATIRIELPFHLRTLARTGPELTLTLTAEPTLANVLTHLETLYPMLRGTIRDQSTHQRRPFLRFFACQQDLSHQSPHTPLPELVQNGHEPLIILGAIAGG